MEEFDLTLIPLVPPPAPVFSKLNPVISPADEGELIVPVPDKSNKTPVAPSGPSKLPKETTCVPELFILKPAAVG